MNRLDLVKLIREILSNAGFYVSDLYSMRPIGFDLVARRDNSLLIIKVLTNINSLSEEVASELKLLSKLLKGHPLLIGERGGTGYLENDVVYDRFGIHSITIDLCTSKKNINAKLSGGKIHMCGPDSEKLAIETAEHIVKHLLDLQTKLDYNHSQGNISEESIQWLKDNVKGDEYGIPVTNPGRRARKRSGS